MIIARNAAFWAPLLRVSLLAIACASGCSKPTAPAGHESAVGSEHPAASSVAIAPSAAPPSPPLADPIPPVPFHATAEDGLALVGTLVRSPARGAPLVVLVHRWAGSREEWAPLVDRLSRHAPVPNVLAFDLRGHGESTHYDTAKGTKTAAWNKLSTSEYTVMTRDIEAALRAVEKQLDAPPRAVALIGSDLGATLASMVAAKHPEVVAVGLISPGASLHGLDLYRPFAEIRQRVSLVAAGADDTVSKEPFDSLAHMATNGTTLRYATAEHSAERLGHEHPELWVDVDGWLTKTAFASESPPSRDAAAD